MHFNTKYIFKGDTEREIIGKINYNFDQILSFAIGPDGHGGPIGPTGIYGPAGRRGATGDNGIRASAWYKQTTEPSIFSNTNDVWIDNSVSDGDIKIFNYPISNNQWQNSGYSFLNSKYFQSYSYILGPGGASDKYAIGFKFPGGITGSANTSLLINDSISSIIGSNPNNSKVVVSTLDQVDRPIMSFSKNGAISDDVPSFYWNSLGSNSALKFDTGGSFYTTTDLDFSIDTDLSRSLISSDYCTFRATNGTFNIDGDGDFHLSSNISIGIGGFLNVSSSNLSITSSSFDYKGCVTITSPLTSTYILSSNPSSFSYRGGISAEVTPNVNESFNFSDYTGNPILSNKPSGSVTSGSFAQTIFGSTGGLTGGTGGPFSYHVKKVREIRQATTTLNARKYLTTTTTDLLDVLDISTNTNWNNENIIATPTNYTPVSIDNIGSYKAGNIDADLNYKSSTATLYGSGFKNGLTGFDQFNGLVTDFYRLSDGSTIFVGSFKYYNEQPVKNGTLNNVLGICKVNADGTLDATFRANITNSLTVYANGGSVNGILVDEYVSGKIFVYGSFSYTVPPLSGGAVRVGIVSFDLNGSIDSTFNTNMGYGFTSGTGVNKAIFHFDGTNDTIVAVGNFTSYNGATKYKLIKIKYNSPTRGARLTTFLPNTNDGFSLLNDIPACLDILPTGNIIIGGTFTGYSYSGTTWPTNHIIEIKGSNGARITNTGLSSMTFSLKSPTDAVITAIKAVSDFTTTPRIYIGGSFTSINGYAYNRIAKIITSGSATITGVFSLDMAYSVGAGFDDVIYDFIHDPATNSSLYVGGRFTTYRGTQSSGFIRLIYDGTIDSTASTNHNVVSPKTVQPSYEYTLGLVRKMYVSPAIMGDDEFLYAGGFLNTVFSISGSGGGIYLKLPSSISSENGYIPVYTDGTTTNYRVFLNDIGNDAKAHYIRGIVFDTGLPTPVTSYVDFSSAGVTGCQYVDLMWASKSSTANLKPRLFYKNCQGVSGYVDFDSRGAGGTIPPNTSQAVTINWSFSRQQTGSFTVYKNGTSLSNQSLNRAVSGSGTLPYDIGDKIYANVSSGSASSGYIGNYASLTISKTSLTTGISTLVFNNSISAETGIINNYSNPVTIESGYTYTIQGNAASSSAGGGCCFVGDTKISMSDGTSRNIEDIIAGDLILTYDPETLLSGIGSVSSIESPIKDDIIEFILSNGTTINSTTEHPFWVISKGWASYSPERTMLDHDMNVAKIEDGDILLDVDGNFVTILAMNDNNIEFKKVYNILMSAGYHTYYANDILVHNKFAYTEAP